MITRTELEQSPDSRDEKILSDNSEHFLGQMNYYGKMETPQVSQDPTDWPFCPFGMIPRNSPPSHHLDERP